MKNKKVQEVLDVLQDSLEEDDKLLQRVKRSDTLSTIALIFTALCLVLKILIHVIVATA